MVIAMMVMLVSTQLRAPKQTFFPLELPVGQKGISGGRYGNNSHSLYARSYHRVLLEAESVYA